MNVDEEKIKLAVRALNLSCEDYVRKKEGTTPLFDRESDGVIFLQVSMKKIPLLKHIKQIKIILPHPCWVDTEDCCLFVPDLNKSKPDNEATIHHYRILLQNSGIDIREIITYNQLKTEYTTFESRRRLTVSYGFFLCDGRISKMLPTLLGKHFIQRRKMPMCMDFRGSDLKKTFLNAISKTSLAITGYGSSCICQIANFSQSTEEITANVMATVKEIERKMPGGEANINGLGLKTAKSITVPFYLSLESSNEVVIPHPEKAGRPVIDELTTEEDTAVMVYPSGRVVVFPTDELASDEEELEKRISKKYNTVNIARKANYRKLRNKIAKGGEKKFLFNKRKATAQKRKKLANLSFKMKQTYKMAQASNVKTPSATLVSVRKRNPERSFRKSPKAASLERNPKKSPVSRDNSSTNRKASNKRSFTGAMTRSSRMAKHM